ncbi:catabolite gene activator [Xylanibacillus composti]|uniref:Catabolite gene activator n=1 Tax=Xylanibacillus composti TaxID=1572762 RepID=A0A8J4H5U4_9BACL|nr:Crp/Fnr family transcriptional regulator [Xylanibacillus composti]GIQ70195.1 catabolite gene activator [Xylanibacillus composti]
MIELLQSVPLFQQLKPEQLAHIAEISTRASYKPGTILFHENDPGNVFYIVASGSVKIYTSSSSGEEKILTTFKAGDSFGELALIDGKPRSASAQTLETSTLYSIQARDFLAVLRQHFEISLGIMQELSKRLRDTNQHVHDLTFLDARTRLVKNLIILANRSGIRNGNTIQIKMMLNYDELSRMAGVQKNVLTEVIREFEQKGLLTVHPDSFTLDLSKLRG